MQDRTHLSLALYVIGLLVMLSLLYLGAVLDPELRRLGMSAYLQKHETSGGLLFFGFVFVFPIGLTLCILAGLSYQKFSIRTVLYVIALTAAISILVLIWPMIVGRDRSPLYFASGGSIMIFLISATAWYWAKQRNATIPAQRLSTDLQGIGYFCFAMATWHSCGVGGLPGFAIHADEAMPVKSYPFILGQLKVVMLYFIIAWLGTLLGFYYRSKHART